LETPEFVSTKEQIKRPALIIVSCPECFKKYKVDGSRFPNNKPSFQCNSCESKFWVSAPDCFNHQQVIGFRSEFHPNNLKSKKAVQEIITSKRTCPKCGFLNAHNDSDCKKCRVVFAKYKSMDINEPRANKHIKELWLNVARNYNDIDMHALFINKCRQNTCLDFAMYKYKKILSVNKNEEIATKMKKQIRALSIAAVKSPTAKNKLNAPKMDFAMKCFFSAIVFMSVVLIMMGLLIPGVKNLIGFGVAVLFVTVGSLFFRHKIHAQ